MTRELGCVNTLAVVMVVATAFLAGCQEQSEPVAAEPKYPQEFLQEQTAPQEVPVAHIIRRDYRLREGDFLEIIYHVRHRRNEVYRIKLQDVIVIRFPFNPSLNQEEQVQSDGYLYLDLIGRVEALGKSIEKLAGNLREKYSKYLKDPTLTVSFKQSNVKIAELKEAITTSPRGQSRLVPITPDGTISLPFIVDIPAVGLTINELHKKLNGAYKEIDLEELEVTVNIQTVAPMRVYILGEARIPGALLDRTGALTTSGEMTLVQAIAQAGSYLPARAELSKVALIRRRHLPRPEMAIINVYQLLENQTRTAGEPVKADSSKWRYDIWLEDGDIIYIPTNDIAKRADYIEYVWTRGIRAVGGFTSTANYTVGDTVDWLGPNP